MASWPSGLPDFVIQQGYGERQQSGVVRSDVDAGPALSRRRFSAVVTQISGQQAMTPAEVATLMTFHDTTLAGGSAAFTWEHPRTGTSVSMRFTAPPAIQPRGAAYMVALSLEVLP